MTGPGAVAVPAPTPPPIVAPPPVPRSTALRGWAGGLWREGRHAVDPAVRRDAWTQVWLVLALSLGAGAVSSVVDLLQDLTSPGGLRGATATLHQSLSAIPVFDLVRQVLGTAFSLVPVALVLYLLGGPLVSGTRAGWRYACRRIGFDGRRPLPDLALGALLAAAIGIPGLGSYLAAHALGLSATVDPGNLPAHWWAWVVYVLSAAENAVLEETVVVGFVLTRLRRGAGWGLGPATVFSAVLRGSYHLYQGFGQFLGNVVLGVAFVAVYRRTGRVMPLVVAHTLIDTVTFVGYALLAGHVSWLPA